MAEWEFPGGLNLTRKGANNAGIEAFTNDIPNSLTREIIQNSMDAKDNNKEGPVRVVFKFHSIRQDELPKQDQLMNKILPQAQVFWQDSQDTLDYLERFKESLELSEINVLTIRDYGTRGLEKGAFEALVSGESYSCKHDDTAGGSKGIGKAAPFAASELRIVFYNSKSLDSQKRAAGVINFVSFNEKEKDCGEIQYITQERGRYSPSDNEINFMKPIREELGTDINIMGLTPLPKWEERIFLSVLANFLVSIYYNKLSVTIEGKTGNRIDINHNTLSKHMNTLKLLCDKKTTSNEWKDVLKEYGTGYRNIIIDTCNYYKILQLSNTDETATFKFPKEFVEKYDFIDSEDDAHLHLMLVDNANRKVLQARKTGMRIEERNRIDGSIPFSGIFIAIGEKLNKMLRSMENVNHDKWSEDRLKPELREMGNKFLRDLGMWYRRCVKEQFEIPSDEEIDAIGMSSILPLDLDRGLAGKESNKSDSGIFVRVKSIKEREKKISTRSLAISGDDEEKELAKIVKLEGLGTGDHGGEGSVYTDKKHGGHGSHENEGSGVGEGNKGPDKTGKRVGPVFREIDASGYLRLKIIEIDALEGLYSLRGILTKSVKNLAIGLYSVGENGKIYVKTIKSASSNNVNTKVVGGAIVINSTKTNNDFNIDVRVNSKVRIKMKGRTYDFKG